MHKLRQRPKHLERKRPVHPLSDAEWTQVFQRNALSAQPRADQTFVCFILLGDRLEIEIHRVPIRRAFDFEAQDRFQIELDAHVNTDSRHRALDAKCPQSAEKMIFQECFDTLRVLYVRIGVMADEI